MLTPVALGEHVPNDSSTYGDGGRASQTGEKSEHYECCTVGRESTQEVENQERQIRDMQHLGVRLSVFVPCRAGYSRRAH